MRYPVRFLQFLLLSGVVVLSVFLYTMSSAPVRNASRNNLEEMVTLNSQIWEEEQREDSDGDDVDFRIIVIVYDRAKSLLRLLNSINEAYYLGASVVLEVWIDRAVSGAIPAETYRTALHFNFKHGRYRIRNHTNHVGIYGQWLNTWNPSENSSEIAVILEDDLTVSPYFYKWLQFVHKKYDEYSDINGFSLQGVSIKHSSYASGYLEPPQYPIGDLVFLYPLVGSWGFSPSRRNWFHFVNWFKNASQTKGFQPLVPGLKSTEWYLHFRKIGKFDAMWTIWHVYHANEHNEWTMYPNFEGHQGLSTNWKEPGLHYSVGDGSNSGPLLTRWNPQFEILPDAPMRLNAAGRIVSQ